MTINANLARQQTEYAQAKAGIRNPEVRLLRAGDILFRFASSQSPGAGTPIPTQRQLQGAWWFLEADYQKVFRRFKDGQLRLATVARSAGAVQPSWSLMDVVVKARLVEDINVWCGKGCTQYRDQLPNGMYVTLTGWPDIEQIYIPDMQGRAFSALQIVFQQPITTDGFGFA